MTALNLHTVSCPLCDEPACQDWLSGTDVRCRLSGTFTIVRCQRCSHRYLNPQPADESLAACYPSDYAPHLAPPIAPATASASSQSDIPLTHPWYLRWLPLRHVPGLRQLYYWLTDDRTQPVPRPRTVSPDSIPQALELGCAGGAWLMKLQAAGWSVCGVELCDGPAAAARKAGLNVFTGTLDTQYLEPQSCDLVAAWMVLEHTPRPRKTLEQIRRLLKPDGQLLFSIPNAACLEARLFGSAWYSLDLPRHLQHFDPATIVTLLQQAGYDRIVIEHHRTLIGAWGSMGILLNRLLPGNSLARWLQRYPEQPRLLLQLLSAPLAILLAWCRQGPGLTVSARRV